MNDIMDEMKKDFPILEYDPEASAIIKAAPGEGVRFPERAVMMFAETEADSYAEANGFETLDRFGLITRQIPVYKAVHNGTEIALCQAPLGGPAAVMLMEALIAGGAKKIIASGCCGALTADSEGDYYIPVSALRQEGTSYHYLPPSREVNLHPEAIGAIADTLDKRGLRYRKCKVWTTDGFFRETKATVERRRAEGCTVVDMECASLAACACFRGAVFGQLLFTADSLADTDGHDTRNWGRNHFASALRLALDAAASL